MTAGIASALFWIPAASALADWPSTLGPTGNLLASGDGLAVVDRLEDARLVWESEETEFGRAKHTTGTFKSEGAVSRLLGPAPEVTPGGWAGPVVADGRLFVATFRPGGRLQDVRNRSGQTVKAYLEADDLLIALDAGTGKTLWKAVEPGGFVWGVGKRNGFQVAPVVADGVVYSMGTTGRLFAYQAVSGDKVWETAPEPEMLAEKRKHLERGDYLSATARYNWQGSLVVAGGHLIVPRQDSLRAFHLESGAPAWQLDKVSSRWATPAIWRHGGEDYLLVATTGAPGSCAMRLIDAASGKVVWTVDGLDATAFTLTPGEDHVLVNIGSEHLRQKANASSPKNAKGEAPYGRLGCYRLSLERAERVWEFPDSECFLLPTWNDSCARPRVLIRDGLVYCSTEGPDKEQHRRFIVARLGDGEVLVDHPRENDFWFQLIGDKLLHSPDWSHGSRASFQLYAAAPRSFARLGEAWRPRQPLTTAYQVAMEPAIVDGRIYWRTELGTVVCYDLRKP